MPGALGNLAAAMRVKDLRDRIVWGVLAYFVVYIIALHIPIPHIDHEKLDSLFKNGGGILGMLDIFSGGAFKRFSIIAMSITPYINASIIIQLMGVAVPAIARIAKEGQAGQKKIAQITRYLTVILAIVQAAGLVWFFGPSQDLKIIDRPFFSMATLSIILTLTAGTCFLMWLAEQISDKGIGNGVSLIIFCGIMIRLPQDMITIGRQVASDPSAETFFRVLLLLVIWVSTVAFIVYVQQGSRKIPVQHARKVVGNRVYGGQTTTLPMRVNTAGVIPIIFAVSLSMLPVQILQFATNMASSAGKTDLALLLSRIEWWCTVGASPLASAVYFLLVVFFTYFYTAVSFNVADVADNLKKSGGFIPGIRPGKPTEQFLDRVLTRITLAGALFLGIVALLQYHVGGITGINFSIIGGTSLLIVVSVAMETMTAIEGQLVMRQYEGFIK